MTTALPTTSNTATDVYAILTGPSETVTAHEVPGTTGLAVVDGTTLSWRHEGITLSNGDVVSLGYNGLVDSTTTALYSTLSAITADSNNSSSSTTSFTVLSTLTNGQTTNTVETGVRPSGGIFISGTETSTGTGHSATGSVSTTASTGGSASGSVTAKASSSSSSAAVPVLSKSAKAVAALAGLMVLAIFAL